MFGTFLRSNMVDKVTGYYDRKSLDKVMNAELDIAEQSIFDEAVKDNLMLARTKNGLLIGQRLLDFNKQRKVLWSGVSANMAMAAALALTNNSYNNSIKSDTADILLEVLALNAPMQNFLARAITKYLFNVLNLNNSTPEKLLENSQYISRDITSAFASGVGQSMIFGPLIEAGSYYTSQVLHEWLFMDDKERSAFGSSTSEAAWKKFFWNRIHTIAGEITMDPFTRLMEKTEVVEPIKRTTKKSNKTKSSLDEAIQRDKNAGLKF
jgi:hypothetical protein